MDKIDTEQIRFVLLQGKYKHYCPDWDFMAIDETCPEFDACTCGLAPKRPENEKIEEALVILQEECAEVIQVVSKIHRFGLDSVSPTGETNLEMLVREIADVLVLIDYLMQNGIIHEAAIAAHKRKKIERLSNFSGLNVKSHA